MNGANGLSDIEGSEPDWQSDEGRSERARAAKEFQRRKQRDAALILFCRSGSDFLGSLFP